jgi:hypothetical protein
MSTAEAFTLQWDWGAGDRDIVEVTDGPDGLALTGRRGDWAYSLRTDPGGATLWVNLAGRGDGGARREVELRRDAQGWRGKDGVPIPNSGDAIDPDIGCTAATNTLPIRRLNLEPGAAAEIDVLLIPVPDVRPRVVRQRYTRCETGYLYENLESGFSAPLVVDPQGWVIDYPGLCNRVEVNR